MVIFATPQESGDESYLHALNLKVPVIVGADRYKACMFAKKTFWYRYNRFRWWFPT